MGVYGVIANWCFSLIDLIAYEIILSLIFTIKPKGGIKYTLDFGMSRFRPTWLYVIIALIVGIIYFSISNNIQNNVISYFTNLGFIVIPSFIMLLGFAGFWLSKIFLGRKFNNLAVVVSLFFMGIGFLIFLFSQL